MNKPTSRRDAGRSTDSPAPAQPRARPEDPRSEEPGFVDEPDLPSGEPSGQPTRDTKPHLPSERKP
jgi:hypothetical protein